MNSKTFTAIQTRRNAYHTPEASMLRRVYREFASLSEILKKERSDHAYLDWKRHYHDH